jgi:hypothetical protein
MFAISKTVDLSKLVQEGQVYWQSTASNCSLIMQLLLFFTETFCQWKCRSTHVKCLNHGCIWPYLPTSPKFVSCAYKFFTNIEIANKMILGTKNFCYKNKCVKPWTNLSWQDEIRGCIFSRVQPFNEWAVSGLDAIEIYAETHLSCSQLIHKRVAHN